MKTRYVIEIYRDAEMEWRFRVKHRNGRIVADSAEGYKKKFFCKRNATNLKLCMYDSMIIEKE